MLCLTLLWCHSGVCKRWALWVMYMMLQRGSEKIPLMGLITGVFLFRTTCWGLTGSLGLRWEGEIHSDVPWKEKKTLRVSFWSKAIAHTEKHRDAICINLYCSLPNCKIHTENNVSSLCTQNWISFAKVLLLLFLNIPQVLDLIFNFQCG